MRALRFGLLAVLVVVVLAGLGLGVFIATFDTQAAVGRLAAQVRRATGRELAVAGPVRLRASWPPEIVAEGVTLSNPPGLSRPDMVRIGEVRARVALAPLLTGLAELEVVLVRPDVLVEAGNWRFQPEPPPAATAPAGPSRAPWLRTGLRRVRVEDGRIGMPGRRTVDVPLAELVRAVDGTLSGTAKLAGEGGAAVLNGSAAPGVWPVRLQAEGMFDVDVVRVTSLVLDAPAADAPLRAQAAATVRGLPVALDLALPPPSLWQGGTGPVALAAASAGATLTVQGTWTAPAGLDATVSARIPDLPALGPLAGTALPALGAVSLDGRVLDRPGTGMPSGVAVRSLRLVAGPGNLAGDIAVAWGVRPGLRGTLTSNRLDVDAILAALPRPPAQPPSAPPPSTAPPPASTAPARLIPDRPLPVAAVGAMDLDLVLQLANVVLAQQAVQGLDARLVAMNGRMRLDPVVLTLPAGRVAGTASADATASPPGWSLDARGSGLRLDRLTDAVHGTADIDLALTATGATTGALAATLDGRATLQLVGGDIDNRLLAPLVDAALRAARVTFDPAGRSPLRCLLLPLTATHGTLSTPGLLLDAQRIRLEGEGTADLATETLALQLRPVLRVGVASVSAPVRVTGPFARPAVALAASNGRMGLSINTAPINDPEACGPSAPEPPPEKPADLLRRLLR